MRSRNPRLGNDLMHSQQPAVSVLMDLKGWDYHTSEIIELYQNYLM